MDVELKGDASSMYSSNLRFVVERCNKEKMGSECKTNEEIDDFIRDIQIDQWALQMHMDFHMYDHEPIFYVNQNHGSFLLNNRTIDHQHL